MYIAVICGGLSAERDVSISSGTGAARALRARGHKVALVDLFLGNPSAVNDPRSVFTSDAGDSVYSVRETEPDLDKIRAQRGGKGLIGPGVIEICRAADIAFLALHGAEGENGKLQACLDLYGVPYTGSGYLGSAIAMDKDLTKRLVAPYVTTAKWRALKYTADEIDAIADETELPCVVKPNANGSSFGVTKVHAPEELPTAIEAAFAQGDEILIEECVAGREMGCGMLVAGGREYVFPITEIVSKKDFFDYEAKYTAGFSDEITPADITPEVKAELNRMTREAYRTCRCSGVVRVDFIVTPAGVPYFIELNSIPGMSGGSIVPKQAREMGMSLGELYDIIIADTCRK